MAITDEEAALLAISSFASEENLSNDQQQAKSSIEQIIASEDSFVDIHGLFAHYNVLYFRSLLVPRIEVSWSPRLTLCAGICELIRDPNNGNKYTRIRLKLSEPLLKYRPRSDVFDTLLHEAIHAYFFVVTDWKHIRGEDGTGHGPGFLLLADAINDHGGYRISVFHTFHDEVNSYRTHIWECDGKCRALPPFFGLVKRSMNRAPGKSDTWWTKHEAECGGIFTKIAEPAPTKEQLQRLTGLERAGRQKNKIDVWAVSISSGRRSTADTSKQEAECSSDEPDKVACPICRELVPLATINEHLDHNH